MAGVSFSTDGLVLKIRHTGESDRIVSVLTRDRGVLSAFAKGARRPKSKLNSGTQSFCFADFSFSQGRSDAMNITEAAVKEVFYDLNKDLYRLALAQYFAQLAEELVPPGDSDGEPLRLLLNALYFLSSEKKDPVVLKAVVELRLCAWAGYMPDLSGCSICGDVGKEEMFLDCSAGVFFCPKCGGSMKGARLSRSAYDAMSNLLTGTLSEAFSLSQPREVVRELGKAAERFVLSQTERGYATLDFLKSVGAK
ncbi:MAG: DNA repair protein RecO [Clostridia bacterium]|nr:DNA repair protein RecO [Clostridia bacterium]